MATILALLAAACALSTGARSSTAGSPSSANVDRWVAELGDDDYAVRQAAADRLAVGGFAARAALAQVADGPDPEIRTAARRLLTLIDDTEFNRLLAEFADDVDGRRGVTLPGWKEFGELVGRDEAARALFVEMQREETALLERMFEAAAGSRALALEEQVARLMHAHSFGLPGEFAARSGSCATLLFLGTLPDAGLSDVGALRLAQVAQLPQVSEALTTNRPENAMRRLVCAWIVHCPNRSEQVLEQRLAIMLQRQLAEALPLPLEIVERDPKYLTLSPSLHVAAILAVGKFGSEQNVADLEPLLDDRTEYLSPAQVNGLSSVQVRDVALATLLHLTGQEPLTYGFLHARTHPQTIFDVRSLYLENDERRAAATEQWRAWRTKRKQDAPRPASS